MKCIAFLIAAVAFSCQSASAAILNIGDYFKGTAVASMYTASSGTVQPITSDIPGLWAPPKTDWINNGSGGSSSLLPGVVTYSTSFTLPSLVPGPLTAITPFSFKLAADNNVEVFVNSLSVGTFTNAFTSLQTINPTLKAGSNTISFVVTNAGSEGNPSGLLVTDVQGTYDSLFVIPEPASIAVWGGVLGFGMLVRRRKK